MRSVAQSLNLVSMDTTAIFRANVRRERERRGMSHRQFADFVGVKHPWTFNLESGASAGKQGVTLTTVDRFCEALEVTVEQLLTEPAVYGAVVSSPGDGPISTSEQGAALLRNVLSDLSEPNGDSSRDSGPGERGGSFVSAPQGRSDVHGTMQRPRRELLRENRTGRQMAQQDLQAGVADGRNTASAGGNDLGPCGNPKCTNRASQKHYPFCSERCR